MDAILNLREKSSLLVILATHDFSLLGKHPTYEIKQGGLIQCQ